MQTSYVCSECMHRCLMAYNIQLIKIQLNKLLEFVQNAYQLYNTELWQNFLLRTPLHFATKFEKLELIEMLIERKANVNAADLFGITPLHLAAEANAIECAKILIDRGSANINVKVHLQIPLQNAFSTVRSVLDRVYLSLVNHSKLFKNALQCGKQTW